MASNDRVPIGVKHAKNLDNDCGCQSQFARWNPQIPALVTKSPPNGGPTITDLGSKQVSPLQNGSNNSGSSNGDGQGTTTGGSGGVSSGGGHHQEDPMAVEVGVWSAEKSSKRLTFLLNEKQQQQQQQVAPHSNGGLNGNGADGGGGGGHSNRLVWTKERTSADRVEENVMRE